MATQAEIEIRNNRLEKVRLYDAMLRRLDRAIDEIDELDERLARLVGRIEPQHFAAMDDLADYTAQRDGILSGTLVA